MQLETETGRLEQLKQQLRQLEKYMKEGMQRRQDISRDGTDAASREQALANVPASVVSENLRVERVEAENGLIYTVSARNVSLLQILEAVAKTAGLPLETRQVPQDRLLNRLWMDLNGVEMSELLRIAAGTQSLDAMADGDGIVVAPLAALSDRPVEKRLRELAVEAYQQALFKYPASAEAPAAYLGIARHYAANNFPTAAIQTAQNILDRWPEDSSAGGPAARDSGDGDGERRPIGVAVDRKLLRGAARIRDGAQDLLSLCRPLPRRGASAGGHGDDRRNLDQGAQVSAQAMPVLEETIRQWPKSDSAPFARMRLAECLAEQQHYDQAVAQLEIIEQNYASFPRQDELNLAMADCQMKLKQFGPARVRLKASLREIARPGPGRARALCAGRFAAGGREDRRGAGGLSRRREPVPGRGAGPTGAGSDGPGLSPDGSLLQSRGRVEVAAGLLARARRRCSPSSSAWPGIISRTGQYERVLALMADPRWPYKYDADPQVLLLAAQAALGSGLVEPALEKATSAAALAKDEETRAQACRLVGECRSLMKEPVRAAMAYGGKTE